MPKDTAVAASLFYLNFIKIFVSHAHNCLVGCDTGTLKMDQAAAHGNYEMVHRKELLN